MYHTYTTDAVVIESAPTGDASRLLWLFTKDLGLILADVKSARGHMSKLRPSIQTHSYGLFTLVRGRYGWKVINVIGRGNYYYELRGNGRAIEVLARTAFVLKKLIGLDDNAHKDIFTLFTNGLIGMKSDDALDVYTIEAVMMCRILSELGFLTDEGLPQEMMSPYFDFGETVLTCAMPFRARINKRINASLRQSGLM